jgi:hypothetical protein
MTAPSEGGSFWQRLRRGAWRLRCDADWPAFAGSGWEGRIMTEAVTDRFHAKQGRSIGRWRLANGSRRLTVYLKRHYRHAWWRGWLAALWPGRGWSDGLTEDRHLAQARELGLSVPRAVAAGELIGPWGRLQSFLAVAELAGMLPLHELIPLAASALPVHELAAWKRGLTAELARLVRRLHAAGYFHRDLYLCHFYAAAADAADRPADWRGRVVVIDLHRLARRRLGAFWWRAKDLGQLLYSTTGVCGVTARDRLRFARLYFGLRRSPAQRLLTALVRLRWRNNLRHNRKRRAADRRAA